MTSGETLDALRAWNATDAPFRSDCTVIELVREQVVRTPGAIAAEFEGATLTYAQLDERAARLASYLRARGVGSEALVGVCLRRSLDMLVAILGIQYARAAYVPVDPTYPRERIAFMLSDSGVLGIVTEAALLDVLPPSDAFIVAIDRDAVGSAPPMVPDPAGGELLAYVIYTSGSTGRPKGVQIEHRSVVNMLTGMQAELAIRPAHSMIALAPISFDISVLDLNLPLITGARVVIAPRETAVDPRALMALMARTRATHVQATPSTWRMLVEAGWCGDPSLTVLAGGEALPLQLAEQLDGRSRAVWNLYGPTEATVWATMHRRTPGEPITIGRPMRNVRAYVVDAELRAVGAGVEGELCIGGAGVARGYLGRPELNAERFIPDPFSDRPGARMYRTGDLARFRADGTIEYIGRSDFQVKLRGHRVELGEIETALEALPEVRAAVTTVRTDDAGDQVLVGYVTVVPGASASSNTLRAALAQHLPSYMVPNVIVVLDALPLTPNGKVDRAQLPAPDRRRDEAMSDAVAARSVLESRLTAIWQDVLDIRPIGVTDNVFDLGATSIVAARLFDRIERELGAKLPLSPLFQAPTIEALAALIERGAGERRTTSLVAIQPLGTRTPIFCVHGGAGTILHFEPLARRLGPDQPFYGLQLQGLYGDTWPHLSVEEMAAHYLAEIATVQPRGPYVLAGYCFGVIVAFEMARRLEARGERVALLINFNGPSPDYIADWNEERWSRMHELADALRGAAGRPPARRTLRSRLGAWVKRTRRNAQVRAVQELTRLYAALRRPLPDA